MMMASNPGFRNAVAASVLAAALAGCADLRWHKDGADPAALDRDLGECQLQARVHARRDVGTFVTEPPRVVGVDRQGRPVMGASSGLDTDRMLLEHDLLRSCMRGKGYELVPVEKR